MTASSQTPPGALPPELPPVPPMPEAERAAYAAYGVAIPAPAGPAVPEAPASSSSVDLATGVIRAAMANGSATAEQIARAEESAGILFDPERASAIASAAYEQALAEDRAELAEAAQDRYARAWFHERWAAAGRLCEDRSLDDMVRVGEVLAALDGRAPATLPLTVRWNGSVSDPSGDGPGETTLVGCTTARGGKAVLVLDQDQRQTLASLLGQQIRDINAPCATPSCGTDHDLDATDLFGWSRLEVASVGDGPRWYCSDMCVFDALARAGHDVVAADREAELGGDL
ncbi:hypothetical protein [Streptomyces pseudovenezuelae]|uniref:hypothetical protein n=1 Tax=Streptomyces pseudovenezuelae TaxID=67350 RepID=UPI0036E9A7FC